MDGTLHGILLSPIEPLATGSCAASTRRFLPVSSARFCCFGADGFVLSLRQVACRENPAESFAPCWRDSARFVQARLDLIHHTQIADELDALGIGAMGLAVGIVKNCRRTKFRQLRLAERKTEAARMINIVAATEAML